MRNSRGASSTLGQVVEALALAQPSRVFCHFASHGFYEEITFLELWNKSVECKQRYGSLGVQPGNVVVVMLRHSPNLIYSYLGAILAGAVPTFMPVANAKQNPTEFWNDHRTLFERLLPRAVVTDDAVGAQIMTDWALPLVVVASETIPSCAPPQPYRHTGAPMESVACLQHSSGTTALKKGVVLTHRAIMDQIDAYGKAIGLTSSDVIVSWLPLYHDMGFIACFMTALITGAQLVALDPFEWVAKPAMLLDAIERYRATLCWLPNFAFSHIVNMAPPSAQWDLSSVRAFINCSEPCKPSTFERFLERFSTSGVRPQMLQVCYAMAENVFAVTQTSLEQLPHSIKVDAAGLAEGFAASPIGNGESIAMLSCGRPVEGVRVRICDADEVDLPDGRVGEIVISSPFLFSGYYKLPQKTAQKLKEGWYWTGDLGFVLDGELYVTGRKDDLLLLNGRNYYAHEIEHIINDVDGVVPGRTLALTVDDPRTDAAGLVVLAECLDDADKVAVGRHVRSILGERLGLALYAFEAVPRGSLIKSTSGKISRNKTREKYLSGTL